jgi:hypothetical protein
LFIGGVHIGARALLDPINLIWFCYIVRLSQWGGVGYFTRSNDYYLPSLRLQEGGGGQHPVCSMNQTGTGLDGNTPAPSQRGTRKPLIPLHDEKSLHPPSPQTR